MGQILNFQVPAEGLELVIFQIMQNSNIFASVLLKINPFLHVHYTKFIKKISLYTNFEFSLEFSMKSQIFLHIYLVHIMYSHNSIIRTLRRAESAVHS